MRLIVSLSVACAVLVACIPPQPAVTPVASPAASPAAPPVAPVADVATTGEPPPAPTAKPAKGARVADEPHGWAVRTPPKWKHVIKDGRAIFGSEREAGMIIVAYAPGVTYEQAEAAIAQQVQALGATPLGPAREHEFAAGHGLIVELAGRGTDGVEFSGRGDLVVGDRGLVIVLGLTSAAKLATLRKRVDAIALSTTFFAPKEPPRGEVGAIAGCFRHSAGTEVFTERTLRFDGQGGVTDDKFAGFNTMYTKAGEYLGAAHGMAGEEVPGAGTYAVTGTTVQLRWSDGSTEVFDLVLHGERVSSLKSGDTWYFTCR